MSTSREFYLPEILASKQYPQVLRVTQPYRIKGARYLNAGQYITVVNRRKIELVNGIDGEGREFKVRIDRSTNVEVIEDERIVYSLGTIIEVVKDIKAIEFKKEIRLDKQTFQCGELFTVEKIIKNFRGKSKNIGLKRMKDGKIYRFPLDLIGLFKLKTGNAMLPLSRLFSLRTFPLKVQFRNTPTNSSSFPSGVVTLQERMLTSVVYILIVTEEAYTYEAFPSDANIFVEKCILRRPTPVSQIIPSGIFASSDEFQNETKQFYKSKMDELDSKLIEDIYSVNYYGSATIEKPPNFDRHLLIQPLSPAHESTNNSIQIITTRTPSPTFSTPSTPDSEYNGRPAPFPRYSKKPRQRNTINFPAIMEQSSSGDQISQRNTIYVEHPSKHDIFHDEKTSISNPGSVRSYESNSVRSFASTLSDGSSRFSSERSFGRSCGQPIGRSTSADLLLSERIYQAPEGVHTKHSRSSSLATENSGDSGIGLSYLNREPILQVSTKPLHSSKTSNENDFLAKSGKPSHSISAEQIHRTTPSNKNKFPVHNVFYENVPTLVRNKNSKPECNNNNVISEPKYEPLPFHRNLNISDSSLKRAGSLPVTNIHYTTNSSIYDVNNISKSKTVDTDNNIEDLDINMLTQHDVSNVLTQLNLTRFIGKFQQELVNGKLLKELDEKTLVEDLGLTQFEAAKLYKYAHGWKPLFSNAIKIVGDSTLNPVAWSILDVVKYLQRINLNNFAAFCEGNQIDGVLLKEVVQNQHLMESLRREHQVNLNGLELSRLKAFVLKEWRPDDTMTRQYSEKQKHSKALWNRLISH